MKLLGLFVVRAVNVGQEPTIISSAIDVSSVGFFQRSSAKEFLVFLARTVAGRITKGSRASVTENGHVIYCQSLTSGLVGLAITDAEYNSRVAFTLVSNVLGNFMDQFTGKWEGADGAKDNFIPWRELETELVRYQNPEEADKILKIRKDIEETKVVMYDAIDKVLARGEKIDNLVQKSEDLSGASKSFYKTAKKTNSSCCIVA